jgi:hypothetical protein
MAVSIFRSQILPEGTEGEYRQLARFPVRNLLLKGGKSMDYCENRGF